MGIISIGHTNIFIVSRRYIFSFHFYHSDLIKKGTLRYEDGKARTATVVDAGNLRGSRRVAKNKMLKMCTFAKDGDVNNLNFT